LCRASASDERALECSPGLDARPQQLPALRDLGAAGLRVGNLDARRALAA
jgi:hypothetical protein